jgi:uncharacterized protein with ATP-grasp and redox domains
MTEFGFFDVYAIEKREENKLGLDLLPDRCEKINKIENINQKWHELFRGLLAGNVYDYGAQAFIEKQKSGEFSLFDKALDSIEDILQENGTESGYSELVERLKSNFYKSICIFVDNSGFDLTLGVLPFVIELLKSKETRVILCANTKAAINDITYAELLIVIKKVCQFNQVIDEAFNNEQPRLIVMESGSASPCLDLSRINISLAKFMKDIQVDLLILEGMGRAIHTNFNAKFKCDSLKAAVIKNEWLAKRFGFHNDEAKKHEDKNEKIAQNKFPIVLKFEKA